VLRLIVAMMTTLAKNRRHITLKINRLTLNRRHAQQQHQAGQYWPADQANDCPKQAIWSVGSVALDHRLPLAKGGMRHKANRNPKFDPTQALASSIWPEMEASAMVGFSG
jgi:hypothetical protein